MFVLGNLIIAIARVIDIVFTIFYWLIFIRAIISWVNPDPYNPIVQFLYITTDPVLYPIRSRLQRIFPGMMFDISPIIAFFAIMFLRSFLVTPFIDIGYRL